MIVGGRIFYLGDESTIILPSLLSCTLRLVNMDSLYLPQRTGHVLLVDARGR
ncbi:hypothetical protein Hanom_Chr06g00548911 [Helianthus anomalus]